MYIFRFVISGGVKIIWLYQKEKPQKPERIKGVQMCGNCNHFASADVPNVAN